MPAITTVPLDKMGQPYPSHSQMAMRGKALGVAISWSSEWEEYRVVPWEQRLSPDLGYYTSDLQDAWDTAVSLKLGGAV